jgi:hypothetical protein
MVQELFRQRRREVPTGVAGPHRHRFLCLDGLFIKITTCLDSEPWGRDKEGLHELQVEVLTVLAKVLRRRIFQLSPIIRIGHGSIDKGSEFLRPHAVEPQDQGDIAQVQLLQIFLQRWMARINLS